MAGFDNEVVYADNVDFSGSFPVTGQVTADGELLIGSTASPNIRVGSLTSTDGFASIVVGAGTIDIQAGGTYSETITGNTGGALPPSAGNWNFLTDNTTVTFAGSGSTLTQDFGISNILLGSEGAITTGTANIGLGFQVLNAIAGGASNVCIGYQAGDAINSGNENVCVGRNSGGNITGGGQNVFFGHASGSAITGGSQNVFFGRNTGASLSGNVNNNIQIGDSVTDSGAVSNRIRIGNGSHTSAFMTAITGVTVAASAPVGVDANSQLSSLGFGTSGQVLTSNGAATSPTWQDASGAFTPESVVQLKDDFFGWRPTGTANLDTELSWFNKNSKMIPITATSSGHPGIIGNESSASGTDYGLFISGTQLGLAIYPSIILGGGVLTLNWVVNVATVSDGTNTYIMRIGIGDTQGAAMANGLYFEYTHSVNSGNWQTVSAASGTRTTKNTSTAASGWVNLGISVNAGNTSVDFIIDGVVDQTHTTNLPSAAVGPMFSVETTAGTIAANSTIVDLFYLAQTLTTGR